MRVTLLLIALLVSTSAPLVPGRVASPTRAVAQTSAHSPEYREQRSWFSRDKAYHFGVSAAGAGGLYAIGRGLGLTRWQSVAASVALMGVAGVWKEVGTTDRGNLLTRAHLSRRDLVWDGVGIAVGVSASTLLDRGPREEGHRGAPAPAR